MDFVFLAVASCSDFSFSSPPPSPLLLYITIDLLPFGAVTLLTVEGADRCEDGDSGRREALLLSSSHFCPLLFSPFFSPPALPPPPCRCPHCAHLSFFPRPSCKRLLCFSPLPTAAIDYLPSWRTVWDTLAFYSPHSGCSLSLLRAFFTRRTETEHA